MKIKLTGLAVAAGILAPVSVLAAPDNGPDAMYVVTNGDPADIDAKTKDLDAQLADAVAEAVQTLKQLQVPAATTSAAR